MTPGTQALLTLVGRTPRSAPDALVRLSRRPVNPPDPGQARPGGRAADEGVRPTPVSPNQRFAAKPLRATSCLLLLSAVPALAAPPASDGVIWGVVRDAWSKTGIKRAVVVLSTTGANPMDAVAYSDSNGAFAFTGVPEGKYLLCARYKGYERGCYGGITEPGRPAPHLTLAAGERKTGIVLAMLPLGSLSGTVIEGDGDPVSNAMVRLLRPSYFRRKLTWQTVSQANTNDRGEYQLSFLIPGRYRVMATRPYQVVNRVRSEVTNGEVHPDEVYAPQFYPNADSADAASTLILSAGNDLKGIDFALNPVEQFTIGGKVEPPHDVDIKTSVEDNAPVVIVFLIPESPGLRNEPFNEGVGAPDYHFQFSVPPGAYRLVATATIGDRAYRTTQKIDVAASTDDLAIALTPGTPIAGTLKFEGAARGSPNKPELYKVRLVAGDNLPLNGEAPVAEVHEDGTFQFDSVVPGLWDIGVEPEPAGSYIKSMMLGDTDVLTADMLLQPGARPPLNIVIGMNGANVSGAVFEAAGQPAGRVMVLLAPEGKFDHVLSFYELRASDDDGHFEFKRVTPGRYKIYAFDHLQADEYWNPDFLKPYAAIGEPFEVGDGAKLKHDTTLIVRGPGGDQ
jgi:hypothetical protein